MSGHTFRNPDKFQELPLRKYIRREFPGGSAGLVVEDLDVVIRHYGTRYQTDAEGRVMLIEQKHPGYGIGTAQRMTFGLMDTLMRKADPDRKRYVGYYLLNIAFGEDDDPVYPVSVNGQSLTRDQFHQWLSGALEIPSYFDNNGSARP